MPLNSTCVQCGATIPEGLEACPECATDRSRKEAVPAFLVIALLCSSLLMVGTSVVNVTSAPPVATTQNEPTDLNLAAYNAAKQFIHDRFPGPKAFGQYGETSIERSGANFSVTLIVEDVSNRNAPVRNYFRVQMEYGAGQWKLIEIAQ